MATMTLNGIAMPIDYPTDAERDDYIAQTRALMGLHQTDLQMGYATGPDADLRDALSLAEGPLKIAAYRAARGTISRGDALTVVDIHHTSVTGFSIPEDTYVRWIDALIEAYAIPEALQTYYAYGDDGQQDIEAESIETAARIDGIPTDEQIADGGWLVVRDDETGAELTFGTRPQ